MTITQREARNGWVARCLSIHPPIPRRLLCEVDALLNRYARKQNYQADAEVVWKLSGGSYSNTQFVLELAVCPMSVMYEEEILLLPGRLENECSIVTILGRSTSRFC
jgi:hypothetical protein